MYKTTKAIEENVEEFFHNFVVGEKAIISVMIKNLEATKKRRHL